VNFHNLFYCLSMSVYHFVNDSVRKLLDTPSYYTLLHLYDLV